MSESRVAKTIRQYANYDDNNPGRHNLISWSNEIERLEAENAKLMELLKEVLACPASFSDARIGYAERQVPIALFDEIRKAVSDDRS